MTDSFNPYAPPRSAVEENPLSSDNSAWRAGKVLIVRKDATPPERCVKCNDEVAGPVRKFKLYWHHPGWYVFILLNIVLYAIVAMIVRKRAVVPLGLCQRHRGRHRLGRWIGWVGTLGSLAVAFFGAASDSAPTLIIGLIGFVLSLVAGIALSRVLHPARIDAQYVRLKGCGAKYLDSLPEFPGA